MAGYIASGSRRLSPELGELIDLLTQTGPITLNKLIIRSTHHPERLYDQIRDLQAKGVVEVEEGQSLRADLSSFSEQDLEEKANELTVSVARRGFALAAGGV